MSLSKMNLVPQIWKENTFIQKYHQFNRILAVIFQNWIHCNKICTESYLLSSVSVYTLSIILTAIACIFITHVYYINTKSRISPDLLSLWDIIHMEWTFDNTLSWFTSSISPTMFSSLNIHVISTCNSCVSRDPSTSPHVFTWYRYA